MNTVAAAHRRPSLGILGLLGGVGLVTAALAGVSESPVLAVAAPLTVALIYAAWSLPLKVSVLALLFVCLATEGLGLPLGGVWNSPLQPVGYLLFTNLSALTGIQALRLPLCDMAVIGLYFISSLQRRSAELSSRTASVRALNLALLGQFGALVVLDIIGTAGGGNFNESLWQMRQLLLFPLRTVVALRAFDGSARDLQLVARVLVAAAMVKAVVGIYFLHAIVIPSGMDVEFTTSHNDTLLFVPVLLIAFNLLLEDFTWNRVARLLWWMPLVLWGAIDNDRRIAWISLGASIFTSVLMAPRTRFKRALGRLAVLSAPIVVLYIGLGWNSGNPIFAGAQMIKGLSGGAKSMTGRSDASIDYRDIENFNVLYTWSETPWVPLGFGHKFINEVPLPDISFAMPTWQYHPHNQYLWLFAIGGPIGFTAMFLPFVVGIFLAARTYRRGGTVFDRAASLTIIGTLLACLNQVFGDMGTLGFTLPLMGSIALAFASKLAVRSGAWPAPANAATAQVPSGAGWSPSA